MPIKGLTDSVQAAFPRIGKLRKGGEAQKNGNGETTRMGPDLQYFRFVSDQPEVVKAFEAAYTTQPIRITVYLPYADVETNFQCWKEKWAQSGLVHRCDGETQTIWLGADGKYRRDPKPCDGGCNEVGRLSVIIPELVKAGFVGFVTFETHGKHDLMSIQASLLATAEARAGNPAGLKGVQWTLRRVKEKISTPMGNGKRARREKWLVKIEPAADWVQVQLQAAHNATMMLPAPREVDEETGEVGGTQAPTIEVEYEPFELPDEPPEEDEEGEPIPVDIAATPTPEPQDEERSKADLREKIGKLADARKISAVQLNAYCQKHYQVAYADASLDTLIALQQVLAEQGKARA